MDALHPRLRALPQASRKSVLRVLHEVLTASGNRRFTQESLRELGIAQFRQTLALLNFLELLDSSGRLVDAVIQSRTEQDKFTDLLRGRVERGYAGHRVDVSFFRSELAPPKSLLKVRQIARLDEKVRSNVLACLLALRELLIHGCDRVWIAEEIRLCECRSDTGGRQDALGKPTFAYENNQSPAVVSQTASEPPAASTLDAAYPSHIALGSSRAIQTQGRVVIEGDRIVIEGGLSTIWLQQPLRTA